MVEARRGSVVCCVWGVGPASNPPTRHQRGTVGQSLTSNIITNKVGNGGQWGVMEGGGYAAVSGHSTQQAGANNAHRPSRKVNALQGGVMGNNTIAGTSHVREGTTGNGMKVTTVWEPQTQRYPAATNGAKAQVQRGPRTWRWGKPGWRGVNGLVAKSVCV